MSHDPLSHVASWLGDWAVNEKNINQDDPLLAIIADHQRLTAEAKDLGNQIDEGCERLQREEDKIIDRILEAEDRIIDTPAVSLGGLVAQLEFLREGRLDPNIDTIIAGVRAAVCGPQP